MEAGVINGVKRQLDEKVVAAVKKHDQKIDEVDQKIVELAKAQHAMAKAQDQILQAIRQNWEVSFH
eukprot:SAG11_NODE_281_length_11257_cov_45.949633_11_plen_66_part_00